MTLAMDKEEKERLEAISKMLTHPLYLKAIQNKKSKTAKKQKPSEVKDEQIAEALGEKPAAKKKPAEKFNTELDPEVMRLGLRLGIYHLEAGVRSYGAWQRKFIADISSILSKDRVELVKPEMRGWYEALRYNPQISQEIKAEMTSAADIDAGNYSTEADIEERLEAALAVFRPKRGQLNSGHNPEVMQAGITLAGYYVEAGARTFAAYSKAMVDDMGDMVQPYLRQWYEVIRYHPELSEEIKSGMTSYAVIEAGNYDVEADNVDEDIT